MFTPFCVEKHRDKVIDFEKKRVYKYLFVKWSFCLLYDKSLNDCFLEKAVNFGSLHGSAIKCLL